MPTTTQTTTSISTGSFMKRGGSCGVVRQAARLAVEEHVVDEAQRVGDTEGAARITATRRVPLPSRPRSRRSSDSSKNISLERKPLNSGTPAMAAAATIARVAVYGM